jgi:hypothetical protein
MLGGFVEIQPRGHVLAIQNGAVGGEIQIVGDVDPAIDLDVTNAGFGHVAVSHDFRTVTDTPAVALDLVLDVVVERCDTCAETGGLGLEVRVADDGAGAATSQYAAIRIGLGDSRRLEGTSYSTLEDPVVVPVVEGIGAWAELAAIGLVVIHASAQGQVERLQVQLVLQIECVLIHAGLLAVEADVVLELGDAILGACGDQVPARGGGDLTVEGVVVLGNFADLLVEGGHQLRVVTQIHLFEVVADLAVKPFPATVVGQIEAEALHLLIIEHGGAIVVPACQAIVLGEDGAQLQILVARSDW